MNVLLTALPVLLLVALGAYFLRATARQNAARSGAARQRMETQKNQRVATWIVIGLIVFATVSVLLGSR